MVKYCAASAAFKSSTMVSARKRKMMRGSGQVLRHKRGVQKLHCGIGKVEKKGGGVVVKYCAARAA